MKSQTEEILWIASQEDRVIPLEIVKFAVKEEIALSRLLDYTESDFKGISASSISVFMNCTKTINIQKYQNIWTGVQYEKVCLIPYDDQYFPTKLKKLKSNDVILLYHKGERIPFTNCVAIVGTRNCSTHAATLTWELSRKVAQMGFTVVAGLAIGIDSAAHRGAISVGGKTIAVLPWMSQPYPKDNHRLVDEITRNGFVISDTFYSTKGILDRGKFVHRNSIISGISDILIAVESHDSAGTRWQVEIAIEQNKPVVAVEPEENNERAYKNFEKFVDMGAIPAKTTDKIIELIQKTKNENLKHESSLLQFSDN